MPGVYKLLSLRNACAWPHAVAGYATPFIAPGVTPPFGLVISGPTFSVGPRNLSERFLATLERQHQRFQVWLDAVNRAGRPWAPIFREGPLPLVRSL